jgi:hypothetical protein
MTICGSCRRIQAESSACSACGGNELLPWPASLTRLHDNEIVGVALADNPTGWGGLGLLFTVAMAFALMPILYLLTLALTGDEALATVVGLFGYPAGLVGGYYAQWRRLRLTRQLRFGAAPERRALPAPRERFEGTARLHQHSVKSLLSPESCLVSAVIARRVDGKDVCDRVEAADFWLDGEGEPILVCGAITVAGSAVRHALSARAALGADLSGLTVYEILVKPGARLSVAGSVSEEQLAELGYRGGSARVMRGVPGAPVEVRVV